MYLIHIRDLEGTNMFLDRTFTQDDIDTLNGRPKASTDFTTGQVLNYYLFPSFDFKCL